MEQLSRSVSWVGLLTGSLGSIHRLRWCWSRASDCSAIIDNDDLNVHDVVKAIEMSYCISPHMFCFYQKEVHPLFLVYCTRFCVIFFFVIQEGR